LLALETASEGFIETPAAQMPIGLTPGSRFGAYVIHSRIGAGGMGEVYRARDTRLGRDIALKTLPQSLTFDAGQLQRFQCEAEALASLNGHHWWLSTE
jgi:serine/threonine protein kinase